MNLLLESGNRVKSFFLRLCFLLFSVLSLGSYSWFPVFILSLCSPSLFPVFFPSPSWFSVFVPRIGFLSWFPVYRAVSRNPNPTTVGATRPKRRRVAATVVGLGFWALHCTLIMVRVRIRTCNSPHNACTACIEDVTAHIAHIHYK